MMTWTSIKKDNDWTSMGMENGVAVMSRRVVVWWKLSPDLISPLNGDIQPRQHLVVSSCG